MFAFEAGGPMEITATQRYSTFHPRCGTSFLMTVMLISMLVYTAIPVTTFWARFAIRLALLPIIAGVSYEIIRYAARHSGSLFALLTRPGLWLQRITTQPPADDMVECAIAALDQAMELEKQRGGELVLAQRACSRNFLYTHELMGVVGFRSSVIGQNRFGGIGRWTESGRKESSFMSGSYRDLRVWQQAMKLTVAVYKVTESFPRSELYGLTSQGDAAVSIPSNIAEGKGHRTDREFSTFLFHARRSLLEVETADHLGTGIRNIFPERTRRPCCSKRLL